MKWKLIGSDVTTSRLILGISKYLFGSTITLTPVSEDEWSVSNLNGVLPDYRVVLKRNRYRFERKEIDIYDKGGIYETHREFR